MANYDEFSKNKLVIFVFFFSFFLAQIESDFDWKIKSTTTSSEIEQMRGLKKKAHLGV
jgi:hypothetical protein